MTTEQPVTALSTEMVRTAQERRELVRDAWTDKELDTVLAAIEAEAVADYRASLAAEDGLGVAWAEAVAALPKGWAIKTLSARFYPVSKLVSHWIVEYVDNHGWHRGGVTGATPTAALEALTAALIEDKPILRDTEYEPPTMKDRARARLHRP